MDLHKNFNFGSCKIVLKSVTNSLSLFWFRARIFDLVDGFCLHHCTIKNCYGFTFSRVDKGLFSFFVMDFFQLGH